jgi:uncharacterized membrane protein YeaQ/YmgE (transglycosylase-associated protein family)
MGKTEILGPEIEAVWSLLGFLLIGLVAGWLAGLLVKGRGFGWLANMIVGVIGALIGGFLFAQLGLTTNTTIGELVAATVGSVVLLFLLRILKKAT